MRTARHGVEGITYLKPKIWEMIPAGIKWKESLQCFKETIERLTSQNLLMDFAKHVFGILVLSQVHSSFFGML